MEGSLSTGKTDLGLSSSNWASPQSISIWRASKRRITREMIHTRYYTFTALYLLPKLLSNTVSYKSRDQNSWDSGGSWSNNYNWKDLLALTLDNCQHYPLTESCSKPCGINKINMMQKGGRVLLYLRDSQFHHSSCFYSGLSRGEAPNMAHLVFLAISHCVRWSKLLKPFLTSRCILLATQKHEFYICTAGINSLNVALKKVRWNDKF
jgi:hypothetical protein